MQPDKTLLARILTKTYPVTPLELQGLADRIGEVEDFYVHLDYLRRPPSESDLSPGRYDYERAASGKMNVGKWIEKRFKPRFPFLRVSLVTPKGRPVSGEELLSYVRGTKPPIFGTTLSLTIKSQLDSPKERAEELSEVAETFSSFTIFQKKELIDRTARILFFKIPVNKLRLETKPMILRCYEACAIEEVLKEGIKQLGLDLQIYHEPFYGSDLSLDECFTSGDLNELIPAQRADFFKLLLKSSFSETPS